MWQNRHKDIVEYEKLKKINIGMPSKNATISLNLSYALNMDKNRKLLKSEIIIKVILVVVVKVRFKRSAHHRSSCTNVNI